MHEARRNIPTGFYLHILLIAVSLAGLDAELVIGDHTLGAIAQAGNRARMALAAKASGAPSIAAIGDLKHGSALLEERKLPAHDKQQAQMNGTLHNTSFAQPDNTPSSVHSAAQALLSCSNAHFGGNPIEFASFVNGRLSTSLRLHRIWWSKRESSLPLALFTDLIFNRADDLEALCRSYPGGVIAAAVWLPLLSSPKGAAAKQQHGATDQELHLAPPQRDLLRNATAALAELFARMESNGSTCALRLLVVSELVAEPQLAVLPPVSTLRNLALLAVDTPLAAMVDADMSVSGSLAGSVMKNATRTADLLRRAESERMAWVMPSWDVNPHVAEKQKGAVTQAMLAVRPELKQQSLLEMWRTRQEILPSASERNAPGQTATNYGLWITSNEEYPVEYPELQEGYEPRFFAARKLLPPYDDRFRGHYLGKVSNVRHVSRNNLLNLVVLPDAWMVQRPRAAALAAADEDDYAQTAKGLGITVSPMDQLVTINGTAAQARTTYRNAAQLFYAAARARQDADDYTPVVHPAVQHCRKVLPWWQQGGAGGTAVRRRLARAFRGGMDV